MALKECMTCHVLISERAQSCPKCGDPSPFKILPKFIECVECKHNIPHGSEVCPECGCPEPCQDTEQHDDQSFELKQRQDSREQTAQNPKEEREPIKLFSIRQIFAASYIGGPLGGGILLYKNFIRLRQIEKAQLALALCIIGQVILMVILVNIPDEVPHEVNLVITLPICAIMTLVAKKLQGSAIKSYHSDHRNIESGGKAAGIGCLTALATIVFMIILAFLLFRE